MRRITYTRRIILEKTKRFIIQNGFEKLTVRNLAFYMNMSTQPIYKQFGSIQGLQDALVKDFFQRLANGISLENLEPEQLFEEYAYYFVHWVRKDYHWFSQLFLSENRNEETTKKLRQTSCRHFQKLWERGSASLPETTLRLEQLHDNYLYVLIGAAVMTGARVDKAQFCTALRPLIATAFQGELLQLESV